MSAHTPGPWRSGGNASYRSIVADGDTGWDDERNVEAYGGHLVCESVSPRNAALIVVAPDLLEVLQDILDDAEPGEDCRLSVANYNRACAAIAKARGEL